MKADKITTYHLECNASDIHVFIQVIDEYLNDDAILDTPLCRKMFKMRTDLNEMISDTIYAS